MKHRLRDHLDATPKDRNKTTHDLGRCPREKPALSVNSLSLSLRLSATLMSRNGCVCPHVTEPTAQWAWEGPAGDSAPRSSEVGPRSPRETMQPGEERRKKQGTPSYADPSSLPGHGGLGRGKELAVQGHAGPGHGRILHVVFRLYQRRDVCEETRL